MIPNENITVIYHEGCLDGFSGAWVAWQKFGDRAEYLPCHEHDELPDIKNKEVYLIDFTFTEPTLKKLKKSNERIIVLDHHESTDEYAGEIANEYRYDKDTSGSIVAWKYFFPEKPTPKLLEYIKDIDLWKFERPHSKEIFKVGELIGLESFEKWSRFVKDIENKKKREENIKLGSALLKHEDRIIEGISNLAYDIKFEGHEIKAINSHAFHSQLGHLLSKRKPPFALVWRKEDKRIKVSLRSDGTFDVGEVAQKYGGGGHQNAASFFIPEDKEIPWKKI